MRWYLAYNLSLRDLEEMIAERSQNVDHSTVHPWVARAARLRHDAQVEDTDFRAERGLDRSSFLKLASCDWIRQRHGSC